MIWGHLAKTFLAGCNSRWSASLRSFSRECAQRPPGGCDKPPSAPFPRAALWLFALFWPLGGLFSVPLAQPDPFLYHAYRSFSPHLTNIWSLVLPAGFLVGVALGGEVSRWIPQGHPASWGGEVAQNLRLAAWVSLGLSLCLGAASCDGHLNDEDRCPWGPGGRTCVAADCGWQCEW